MRGPCIWPNGFNLTCTGVTVGPVCSFVYATFSQHFVVFLSVACVAGRDSPSSINVHVLVLCTF